MRIENLSTIFLLSALVLVSTAWAQDSWQAQLEPPRSQQAFTPTESLHIDLPASLQAETRSRLALEVDAIDVTALVEQSDAGLTYTPVQAFKPGPHRVRLVEYDDRGAVHEHGVWSFTVAAIAKVAGPAGTIPASQAAAVTPTTAQFRADVSLAATERVAKHGLSAPLPARFSSDGSASLGLTTKGAHWSTVTQVDLTEASPQNITSPVNPGGPASSGRSVQLGQFSISAQSATTHLVVGDQSLPYNGLVVSQLNRRGISGTMKVQPWHGRIGVFSMRSNVISGFSHGLGVTDPEHRVSGALLDLHPFKRAEELRLTLAYASGRGAADGTATYNVPLLNTPSGSAYGLDVDSQLLDRRLHVHAALARSEYDFGVPSLPRRADSARNFMVSYLPGSASGSSPVSSQTTLSYQSTGNFFRSLANPMIAPDLSQWQLAQSLNGQSWSLQGGFGLGSDNVDSNPALATVYTRRMQGAVGLSPSSSPQPGSFAAWLGTPYYSLSVDASRSRNGKRPTASYPRTNLDISNLNASAQFSHERWNWNLGLLLGRTTDHTGQQNNTSVFGPTFGANITLGSRGSLGFAMQYTDTYDRTVRHHSLDTSYNIYGSSDLVANKLSMQFNFSITRTAQAVSQFMGQPIPSASYNTRTLSGGLIWHALAARSNHPGLDLSLTGTWNHGGYPVQTPGYSADNYQIFLKVNVVLPWRYPGDTQ